MIVLGLSKLTWNAELGWHPIIHETVIANKGSWQLYAPWKSSPKTATKSDEYDCVVSVDISDTNKLTDFYVIKNVEKLPNIASDIKTVDKTSITVQITDTIDNVLG